MADNYPDDGRVEISASPVSKKVSAYGSWDYDTECHGDGEVVAVLPLDNFIFPEVGYVCGTWFDPRFHDHPKDVGL